MIQSRLQSKSFRLPWPTEDVQYTVTLKNPVFNTEILNPITEVVSYRPNNHRPTHSTRIIIPSPKKEKKEELNSKQQNSIKGEKGFRKRPQCRRSWGLFLPRGSFGTGSTSSMRCASVFWEGEGRAIRCGTTTFVGYFSRGVFFLLLYGSEGFFSNVILFHCILFFERWEWITISDFSLDTVTFPFLFFFFLCSRLRYSRVRKFLERGIWDLFFFSYVLFWVTSLGLSGSAPDLSSPPSSSSSSQNPFSSDP